MPASRTLFTTTLGVALCAVSCTGVIGEVRDDQASGEPRARAEAGGGGASTGGATGAPGSGGGSSRPPSFDGAPADPKAAGPLGLRLLTRREYENTVHDLLEVATGEGGAFPAESQAETGFFQVQKVDDLNVAAYQDVALAIAAESAKSLAAVYGCDPDTANEYACVESFLASFGRRAYRRPLTSVEIGEHLAFYRDVLRAELALPVPEAAELLLAAILQSPHFLYRWELGSEPGAVEDGVVQLNPHHLASRLSYFLWASMPDPALFAAAESGALEDPDRLEAQARRMLGDPKAARTVAAFHEQWLRLTALPELGKSAGQYPAWNAELGAAMAEEVRRFATSVVLNGDGRLETLFTSRSTFVNEPLARLYGLSGPLGVTGSAFVGRELPEGERYGLFTLAGFLAAHSGEVEGSPIFRGKFIREHVLCDPMSPPPPNIPDLPEPAIGLRKRERYEEHSRVSPCKDCHLKMDYIGYGFEHFDAIGAYQEKDAEFDIDATGVVRNLDGSDPGFDGVNELVSLLKGSAQVRACVAREWFRFTFSRREGAPDRASFDEAYAAFAASDYDIRELLVAFVKTRSFRYRAVAPGEVLQ
jgi:hypothetical protein